MRRAGRERTEEQRGGLRPAQTRRAAPGAPSPAAPRRGPAPAPPELAACPPPAPAARARPPESVCAHLSPYAGAMAEQESLEFGKADFVLMDTVSMPEFMANLRLR